jgi:hypothetical protein
MKVPTLRKAGQPDSDTTAERRQPGPVQSGAWRTAAVTALLAAGSIIWAAYPLNTGRAGTKIAVIAAIAAGVLTVGQVTLAAVPRLQVSDVREILWPEILVVALIVLEALHHARPLHTGILAVALLACIFAVHLAETGARPSILRAQLPVIAAGIGLLVLAVGVAYVHEATTGPAYTALRILAVVSAVVAAALAVPVGGWRRS